MENLLLDYLAMRKKYALARLSNSQDSVYWRNFWAGYIEAINAIQNFLDIMLEKELNKMCEAQEGANNEKDL